MTRKSRAQMENPGRGRIENLYDPLWYERVQQNGKEFFKEKNFILDLDLFPTYCLPAFELPAGSRVVGMREVHGIVGTAAMRAELLKLGTNQHTVKNKNNESESEYNSNSSH